MLWFGWFLLSNITLLLIVLVSCSGSRRASQAGGTFYMRGHGRLDGFSGRLYGGRWVELLPLLLTFLLLLFLHSAHPLPPCTTPYCCLWLGSFIQLRWRTGSRILHLSSCPTLFMFQACFARGAVWTAWRDDVPAASVRLRAWRRLRHGSSPPRVALRISSCLAYPNALLLLYVPACARACLFSCASYSLPLLLPSSLTRRPQFSSLSNISFSSCQLYPDPCAWAGCMCVLCLYLLCCASGGRTGTPAHAQTNMPAVST